MEVPAPTPTPARPSKREIAKEYALKVPKPRMREATAQEADGVSASAPGSPAPQRDDEEDVLAALERQHELRKAQAAQIRQELGL